MKILYAIQGTGNGHLSRAMDIVPLLKKMADVDVLVSGVQGDLILPFPVKYQFKGLGFMFGKSGGVDMYSTFVKMKSKRLYNEVKQLPVTDYDLVISDFEPVSAWACYAADKECISLSHQTAVTSSKSPKPKNFDLIGQMVLRYYAPSTSQYGFHFERYDSNIYTPVIRQQVRYAKVSTMEHITVYLPSFDDDRLIKSFSRFKGIKWQIFSKHNKKPVFMKHITILPIQNELFIDSMASSNGVICGAGFETPAEALFLGKKLLVIPMKGQYEQHCNAAALRKMGVAVIKSLKQKHDTTIEEWLKNGKRMEVNYPDETQHILEQIISKHWKAPSPTDIAIQWDKELEMES
ncbi:MAG: glycosyl transferase [Cytophagales bacterium]|nr:glycosyl transferase [Cytophaga sp.]